MAYDDDEGVSEANDSRRQLADGRRQELVLTWDDADKLWGRVGLSGLAPNTRPSTRVPVLKREGE
jgi:hypothetical protein